MATKTANVLARVEPDVKEQAELILSQLGIPTSVLINMLYRQIIMLKAIPFTLKLPNAPVAQDEMDDSTYNSMMQRGLEDATDGRSRPMTEVFSELRREIE